jgi:dephospho-CoA kinase
MSRIAITGGIAEGKSTVLGYCKLAGYETLSADEVARDVFEANGVQGALAELLGCEPPVSRQALRTAIQADPEVRRSVNAITHPQILARMTESSARFVEVPLLIETCLHPEFDHIWVVTCGLEEQLTRLSTRIGEAEAKALIATQLPSSAKTPFADLIIRTNQPERSVCTYVLSQVENVFRTE